MDAAAVSVAADVALRAGDPKEIDLDAAAVATDVALGAGDPKKVDLDATTALRAGDPKDLIWILLPSPSPPTLMWMWMLWGLGTRKRSILLQMVKYFCHS